MDEAGEANAARSAALVGGTAIVIGCLLPWLSIATATSSDSRTGLEHGGGKVAIILGIAIVVVAGADLVGWKIPDGIAKLVLLVLGAAAVVIAGLNVLDVRDETVELTDDFVSASAAIGIWIVSSGALVAVAGGALFPVRPR
jgi:hypothetical protein